MSDTSSSSASTLVTLTILHAGRATQLELASSATVSDLEAEVAHQLGVAPAQQKLIVKGKRINGGESGATRLSALKLVSGARVLLVGILASTAAGLDQAERLRVSKHNGFLLHQSNPHRPRSTASPSSATTDTFKFHSIEPFPATAAPHYEKRLARLQKLASDPAVLDIMKRREYSVGVLTELHPHVDPTILGLNVNAGQVIKLRLLTDALDGLISESEVLKVLLHELVHNVQGEHNVRFHTLNSELNKELRAYRTEHGITNLPDSSVWSPATDDASEAERKARFDRRLDEVEIKTNRMASLQLTEEDEVDERRERARIAAEARLRGAGE